MPPQQRDDAQIKRHWGKNNLCCFRKKIVEKKGPAFLPSPELETNVLREEKDRYLICRCSMPSHRIRVQSWIQILNGSPWKWKALSAAALGIQVKIPRKECASKELVWKMSNFLRENISIIEWKPTRFNWLFKRVCGLKGTSESQGFSIKFAENGFKEKGKKSALKFAHTQLCARFHGLFLDLIW